MLYIQKRSVAVFRDVMRTGSEFSLPLPQLSSSFRQFCRLHGPHSSGAVISPPALPLIFFDRGVALVHSFVSSSMRASGTVLENSSDLEHRTHRQTVVSSLMTLKATERKRGKHHLGGSA